MDTNQEVLEKVKDFISQITTVNDLYDQFLKAKENHDEVAAADSLEKFSQKYKKLTDKNNDLFITDFDDVAYPNEKAIITSLTIGAEVLKVPIFDGEKCKPIRRQLTKASIHYLIINDEIDGIKPYFGMIFILTLDADISTINGAISVAIARTKHGHHLTTQNFDTENLTISNPLTEIQFDIAKDFADVVRFCEETINLLNEHLSPEKLIKAIKLCQG